MATPQAGPDLQEWETEELGFAQVELQSGARVKFFEPWTSEQQPSPTSSLLSIASKRGLVAAAGHDTLVIVGTDDLRKQYIPKRLKKGDAGNTTGEDEPDLKPLKPKTTIQVPRVSHVAFNADESCLAIAAEQGGGLAIYNAEKLSQGGINITSDFQLATNNTSVRHLIPNPVLAHLFAVVLSNGQLVLADLQQQQLVRNTQGNPVFHQGVTCVAWSKLGKQLVAGLEDGSAVQIDPQGNIKDRIPKPPQLESIRRDTYASASALPITAISWLSNYEFFLVYTPFNPPDADMPATDSVYFFAGREKTTPFTFSRFAIDPCMAFIPRTPAHHYIHRLSEWAPKLQDALIIASTASVDLGIFSRLKEQPFNTVAIKEDSRKATLPMSILENGEDSSVVGAAFDFSANVLTWRPIPTEADTMEDAPTPLPTYCVLTTDGILVMWWFIYGDGLRNKALYPALTKTDSSIWVKYDHFQAAAPSNDAAGDMEDDDTSPNKVATPAATPFGAPSATPAPAFGQTSTAPAFGKPAFGAPATPGFGGTSALGQKSVWGGGNAAATTSPTSGFGKPAFGSSTAIGLGTGFGQVGGMGMNKPSPWAAATGSASTASPSSPFGNTSAQSPFAKTANQGSGFSAFATGTTPTSPFASAGQTSAFGKPSLPKDTSVGSTATLGSSSSGGFTFAQNNSFGQPAGSGFSFSSLTSKQDSSKDDDMEEDSFKQAGTEQNVPANGGAFGLPAGAFKLNSTFKGDGSAKNDLPKGAVKLNLFGQPLDEVIKNQKEEEKKNPKPPFTFADPEPAAEKPANTFSFGSASANTTGQSPFAGSFGKPSGSTEAPKNLFAGSFGKPSGVPSNDAEKAKSPFAGGFGGASINDSFKSPFASAFNSAPSNSEKDKENKPNPFSNMFGNSSSAGPKLSPFIKPELGTEKLPSLKDIPEAKPAAPEPKVVPEEAPLPPDPMTYKAPKMPDDLPPLGGEPVKKAAEALLAGSPPVDLGSEKFSSFAPSQTEGPAEDDEEEEDWEEEDDEEGEEDDDGEEGDEDDEDEDDDDDDDDEEEVLEDEEEATDTISDPQALSAFMKRVTPASPKVSQSAAESTTPESTVKSSYTPAGLPKGPHFPIPRPQVNASPRSPSPTRAVTSPVRGSVHSLGPLPPQIKQVSIPPAKSIEQPPPAPAPREPTAGELEDAANERLRELLLAPIEPSKTLPSFFTHHEYIGSRDKPGLGGQIETVFRDVNSMIDVIGLNARSLSTFVSGHDKLRKAGGRTRSDLDNDQDWCIGEVGELVKIETELEKQLANGKITNAQHKVNDLELEEAEAMKARAKVMEIRKQLAAHTDPEQIALQANAPLPPDVQTQQTDLRHGVQKVQKLLSELEEKMTLLRADLASIAAQQNLDKSSNAAVPTVEAVTNTILKMTAMIEQRSGDIDVLEAQIRRLPDGIASLRLTDYEGDLSRSLSSSRLLTNGSPVHRSTPPRRPRMAANGDALGMSGMFGLASSRYKTPPSQRRSIVFSPEASALGRSTGSLNGSARKKMNDVEAEEIEHFNAQQMRRKEVLEALKSKLEVKGARIIKVK